MIQPSKAFPFDPGLAPRSPSPATSADASLRVLLKNALQPVQHGHDGGAAWQMLTRKVLGPFGAPALEGPTASSLELELTSSGGWSHPIPFVLKPAQSRPELVHEGGSYSLWSLLRFDSLGLPQRGCNWLLA